MVEANCRPKEAPKEGANARGERGCRRASGAWYAGAGEGARYAFIGAGARYAFIGAGAR